jgi:hypothetical protein
MNYDLYWRLLLELGGHYGRQIQEQLGIESTEVYRAIRDRMSHAVDDHGRVAAEWRPDQVDLAAALALGRAVLKHHGQSEFRVITGFSLEDVRRLVDDVRRV